MPENQDKWRMGCGNMGGPKLSLVKGNGKPCAGQAAQGGDISQEVSGTQLRNWKMDKKTSPASV